MKSAVPSDTFHVFLDVVIAGGRPLRLFADFCRLDGECVDELLGGSDS